MQWFHNQMDIQTDIINYHVTLIMLHQSQCVIVNVVAIGGSNWLYDQVNTKHVVELELIKWLVITHHIVLYMKDTHCIYFLSEMVLA